MANEITSIKIGTVEYPINFRTNSYNYTNGTLVKLNVAYNTNAMIHVHIIGNAYTTTNTSKVVNTIVEFYNYQSDNAIINYNATHFGHNFGDIKIFNYDSKICLWFKQDHNYMSFSVYANYTNSDSAKNIVLSISNAAMPTSGVTRLITLTPKQISYSDHNHDARYYTESEVDSLLAGKADTHSHNYISSTTTRTKNTVLAGPASGSNAAPTFRALVAADIPNIPATKITSEKLSIDRIPTGTTSGTVALGNHTHKFTWNNNDTNLETILGNLQAQITANATAIQNKSDIHDHNYISSTTTRTKNTVLAGPASGSNAAPTFRALVAADIPSLDASKITSGTFNVDRIPSLAASKITSGTFDVARIPTGTTSTTVALGNHTHSQYATVEQLDESELATAEALNDLDTKLDGKAESDHIHDERYYTETEVNNLLAGKANSSHTHGNDLPVKLINAPSIATLQTYGLPSDYTSTHNRTEYFKAFIKYLQTTAPGYTCVGYLSPSSRGSYICDVYNNGFNSETGLPEHITGHYFQHAGTHTAFGTSYGNYYEYEYLNSNNFSGYAAIKNHTHSYLPLSGGTMTGTINSQSIIPVTTHSSSSTGYSLGSSTKQFNTVYSRYIDTVSGFNLRLKAGGTEHFNMYDGIINVTGSMLPTTNNTYTLGNSTYNWKNIYGVNFFQNGVNIKDIYPDAKYADFCASYLHSPNRAQFCRPSGVTIEYSTNSGSTWIDYGATNEQKVGFFSGFSQNFILGKGISTKSLPSDMLRITMDATEMGFYTSCKSLLINISTNGSNNFRVKVEKSMKGSVDTFTTLIESQTLTGWSGWNRIPIGYSFGGGATQTYNIAKIRLTFMSDGASSSYTSGAHPYVIDMEVLGNTYWATPHTMAKTGHIYEWDVNGNAIFLNDINISKGSDLILQASSSTPTDPGDLVFANSSGTELGRIWLDPGSVFKLRYSANDTAKTIIHSGNIGSYANLYTHPTSHPASMITGLATVATSGSYNDLSNKPTIPAAYDDTALTNALTNHINDTSAHKDTTYSAGTNITISGTTISAKDTTYSAGDNITISGTTISAKDTTYSNFVKSGSGAKAGLVPAPSTTSGTTKYLREDGTWVTPPGTYSHPTNGANTTKGPTADVTGTDGTTIKVPKITVDSLGHVTGLSEYTYTSKNTTYSNMTGATSSATGSSGLVPAPAAGKQASFLRGDGTWATPSSAPYISPYSIIFEGRLPTVVECTDNDYTDTLKFGKDVRTDLGFVYDEDRSIIKFYDTDSDKSGKIGFTDFYGPNDCESNYCNYLYLKSDYGTLIDATNGPLIINNENVSIFSNDFGPQKSSVKVPLCDNYDKKTSSSSYTASSAYTSQISFSTTFANGYTRNAITSSATNINISGSTTSKYYSVPAGQTIKLDVGISCIAYLYGKFVDLGSDYSCPNCDSTLDTTYVYPHPYNIEDIIIRFYLSSSSSGSYTGTVYAYKDIRLDATYFAGLYKSSLNIGTTTYPGIYASFEYTNTGSSSKTVYLRAVVLRNATSQKTFTSGYEATQWLYSPYEYEYIMNDWDSFLVPECPVCNISIHDATIWSSYYRDCVSMGTSTFTQYIRNIYTFYKESIYTKTSLQIPTSYKYVLINKDTLYLGNMNVNDSDNSSYYANIINKEYVLHKFAGYPSTFYLDYEKLNYNIYTSSSTDTEKYNPAISFNINTNGLHLYSSNSTTSSTYTYKTDLTNYSELKLFYNTNGVTIKYNGLTPATSGTFTLGSSSYRLGTIYSNSNINTSDERFKNWISDIDIDFEKLKKIPKKLFTWRDSFLKDDDDIHIGTSAQVIRDIYPEIVHVYNSDVDFCPPRDIYDPDAVLAIEYDKLGVIALAAVDKLHEENVQLKEENEQLKTRLDNLEAILKEKGIL